MDILRLVQTFILLVITAVCSVADASTTVTSDAVSQYDLAIKILPDAHRLEVSGKWRLPAIPTERKQIEFYLSPKMEALNVQLLEPKACAPIVLVSSQEEGGDTKWIFKPTLPIGSVLI